MTSREPSPAQPRPDRFHDALIRPFATVTVIIVTAVELPGARLIAPVLALSLFAVVSALSISALFPWPRLRPWHRAGLLAGYAVGAAVLLPLAHATSVSAAFAFLASAAAGAKLASRRAAVAVAVLGALTATATTWVVTQVTSAPGQWPWWLTLTVGLPVYIGISRRDQVNAVLSARRAALQAQRAAASEAREAALVERGRIAREIHDVLGHSLSGIALQLDMADALNSSGRGEEAVQAIRTARALAVNSIGDTRRAVHALREDTLPLTETLRLMANGDAVAFQVVGEPGAVTVEAAHTVVRAAQEALTNAAKYAPGAARAMTLTCTEDQVSLTVANAPATAEAPAEVASGSGMGLIGMRERVALLGGTLRAGPDPDGGWTVHLAVPR
ncbi:hypothetical protein GCM10010174_69480 [Kutzneria viridogrisea]|uniref:histidine kinase n=1 Tax=Kutzneria viridogrisea TaxID=47990 RepID=A0ABR6BAZ9_9PSEU|nr:signal transduction histidine kinase [Kutzneria viridogrisea]